MGFGRYVLIRILNVLILLMLVILVMFVLFVKVVEKDFQNCIIEQVNVEFQVFQKQGRVLENFDQWRVERIVYYRYEYKFDWFYVWRVMYYFKCIIMFDFGNIRNFVFGFERDVKVILKRVILRIIQLFIMVQIIIIFFGIFLGVKVVQKVGSVFDRVFLVFVLVISSILMWWFGMIMFFIFVFEFGWFLVRLILDFNLIGWVYIVDMLKCMVLLVVIIVFVFFGVWVWVIRNIMIGIMQEDFIMVVRVKGVLERKVIYGYVFRVVVFFVVIMIIMSFFGLLGGVIIIESVFMWFGMGRVYWIVFEINEMNFIMGFMFVNVIFYFVGVIFVDFMYGFFDLRVKVGVFQNV